MLRTHEGDEVSGLSKINFITFDNNRTKWQDFKDLFKTLEHNIDKILPIREMQYLKICFIVKADKAHCENQNKGWRLFLGMGLITRILLLL